MRTRLLVRAPIYLAVAVLAGCAAAMAQSRSEAAEILAVVQKSAADWNRGDLEAFVQCYEPSPETTFVGSEVSRGTDAVLSRYKRTYPDAAHMGATTFSELEARILSSELAIVTGRFRLERESQFGGNKTGLFTLVMRKSGAGWRIIHDHTSAAN